jgi:hypothetical protein
MNIRGFKVNIRQEILQQGFTAEMTFMGLSSSNRLLGQQCKVGGDL